jgi:hypothetical protein
MTNDNENRLMAKAILRNATLINLLLNAASDHARIIMGVVPRCGMECSSPATISHPKLPVQYCDRHAAEIIVKASKGLTAQELSREDDWLDLPNAEHIRRLDDHVTELKKHDGAEYH